MTRMAPRPEMTDFERRTRMMQWAMTLRELLHAGILDMDHAAELVAEFKRACERERRLA
jgi:hypothetical protein